MDIHTAFQAPQSTDLGRPKCPRCGLTLLMAEQSEFSPIGRIRHTWFCDDCGNEFVTSIRVLPPQA
jgi:ribosomal protein S27AE